VKLVCYVARGTRPVTFSDMSASSSPLLGMLKADFRAHDKKSFLF